jgi:hypothetical protein
MQEYSLDGRMVAATLLRRHHRLVAGSTSAEHALSWEKGGGLTIRVASDPPGRPLFELVVDHRTDTSQLVSPFGELSLGGAELAFSQPDPLWDSCHSICSHMEDDHADSFAIFMQSLGREPEPELRMPWVESHGFFLADSQGYHFIPFPEPCLDPNSVRKTLISMLRAARAATP